MKEIKILETEIQIGDNKFKLSVEEMHELKRVLLEALPEPYPQYIPYIPYQPSPVWVDDMTQPQYVITTWNTTAGEVQVLNS